mgnify:CR=1 FL=1
MKSVLIDQKTCTICQRCIRICPTSVLRSIDGKILAKYPERCIACGQCFAFCPTGSISLNGCDPREALPCAAGTLPDETTLRTLIQGRRSIRLYRNDPVPKNLVQKALDLSGHAPSGGNLRPMRWTVVQSRERVHAIAAAVIEWMRSELDAGNPLASLLNYPGLVASWDKGNDPVIRGAPHLVFAHFPGSVAHTMHAGVIACTTLELAFAGLGIGSCWAGFLMIAAAAPSGKAVLQACGLDEGSSILGGLMFGYPDGTPLRVPPRAPYPIDWIS